ncbi:MAG: hypothetical protein EBZ47_02825 [Chlamydiae bacterium]|nr:hypothetical protein [Chlamydiota bacterium]
MSLHLNSILQEPSIKSALCNFDELNKAILKEKVKIKQGTSFSSLSPKISHKIFETIFHLGDALKNIPVSNPLSTRVSEIGRLISHTLAGGSKDPEELLSIPYQVLNEIQTCLRHEVGCVGAVLPHLRYRLAFFEKIKTHLEDIGQDPYEIFSLFLALKNEKKILLSEDPNAVEIKFEISYFSDLIDSMAIKETSNHHDRLIFSFISQLEIVDNFVILKDEEFLPEFFIQFLSSDHKGVQKIGALIAICAMLKDSISHPETSLCSFSMAEALMLGEEDYNYDHPDVSDERIDALSFNRFRDFHQLLPYLCKIIEKRNLLEKKGLSFELCFLDYQILQEIVEFIPSQWHEELEDLYRLTLSIKERLEKLTFTYSRESTLVKNTTELSSELKEIALYVLIAYKTHHKACPFSSSELDPYSFTLSNCPNIEEFQRFSNIVRLQELIPATSQKELEVEVATRSSKKVEKSKKSGKSCKKNKHHSSAQKKVSSAHFEPASSSLSDSIADTEPSEMPIESLNGDKLDPFLLLNPIGIDKMIIHPRVDAWFRSAKEGLLSHKYDSSHFLPEDEMILRHRFPTEIVRILLDPRFAKKRNFSNHSHQVCLESLMKINHKKYKLEAAIDEHNRLFHLYAKPLVHLSDYLSATFSSKVEYPPLSEAKGPLVYPSSSSNIQKTLEGSICFDFEGNYYEILDLTHSAKG